MAEVIYEKMMLLASAALMLLPLTAAARVGIFCRFRVCAHGMVWLRLRAVLPPVSVRSLLRRAQRPAR